MATTQATTTSASLSLGGAGFTGQVSLLNSKFTEGAIIRSSHLSDLASLMLTAAGHYHTWNDLYGKKTFGNTNPNGYSDRGSYNLTVSVDVIPTNFGLPSGIADEAVISKSHYNYSITIYNALRNHSHTTWDDVS